MKSKLLIAMLSLVLVRVARAESYTPAVVTDTMVIQPGIGFSGFSFPIPDGYYHFIPMKKDRRTFESAQWAWSMSTDWSRLPGVTSLEHIAFAKRNRGIGITLGINRTARFIPGFRDRLAYKADVESSTGHVIFQDGIVEFRDSREIGDKYMGRATRNFPEYDKYNAVYILDLPPRYELVFNGISASKDRNELMSDMEAMIASLKFSVPKKP